MVRVVLRFPDVQVLLVTDLAALVGAGHTDTVTPDNLADLLPFIRVRRIGGHSDRINDIPTVQIDAFGLLYGDVVGLCESIRDRVVGPPPTIPQVDRAQCQVGPHELPYGAGPILRWGAIYSLELRRRAT